jgi:hypothetical protein
MPSWSTQQRLGVCLLAAGTLALAGCADGHLSFFGYSSAPNYDCSIRTVYVPIPGNPTYRRGLEFDLKRALDKYVALNTPFTAVPYRDNADTELIVKIISRTKTIVNFNQLGEIREGELTMTAEVTWLDKRIGHIDEVLSKPAVVGPLPTAVPVSPVLPLPGVDPLAPLPKAPPIIVTATASYHPELGGSTVSAEQQLINKMAVQIVSMMEKPW